MLTNATISQEFLIEGDVSKISVRSNLQTYSLMFNNPLSVGNGDLAIQDFKIEAKKIPVTIEFYSFMGVLIIFGVYFFSLFT